MSIYNIKILVYVNLYVLVLINGPVRSRRLERLMLLICIYCTRADIENLCECDWRTDLAAGDCELDGGVRVAVLEAVAEGGRASGQHGHAVRGPRAARHELLRIVGVDAALDRIRALL